MKKFTIALTFVILTAFSANAITVSGQVKSPSSNGLYHAVVRVVSGNCNSWQGAAVYTNPFGYYAIYNVPDDCNDYVIAVQDKNYLEWTPNEYVFIEPQTSDLTNMDFQALP